MGVRAGRIPGQNRQLFAGQLTGPSPGVPAPERDGRSKDVKRARARLHAYGTDKGGLSEQSQIALDLMERLAVTVHFIEKIEDVVMKHRKLPPPVWFELLDRQMRLSQLLGLERKARRVPSLQEYIASKSAAPVAGDVPYSATSPDPTTGAADLSDAEDAAP